MQPDMARRLEELQQRSARLGQLAARLRAATPRQATGSDPQQVITAVLGGDGLPAQFTVQTGWQRKVAAQNLAQAVREAVDEALRAGMRSWSAALADQPASSTELPSPPSGTVRDSEKLAEDVISALADARQQAPAPAPGTSGHDDGKHVTLEVGPQGLTACRIDERWAAQQDGATLGAALNAALRRARAARRSSAARGDVDALAGDALATLIDLTSARTDTPGQR
ncbi:hypothetical protein [Actinoplanes sp. RD1]|uniref:hypothetical protein n=1 Tax=Actinoplanes sp. RD1 TaxID=3064538 RepID=UPI00274298F5|nr:hypothetical protein [Actinoplanes sp. RD1]